MTAYLAEERRRDPHSVVKERSLPAGVVTPSQGLPCHHGTNRHTRWVT